MKYSILFASLITVFGLSACEVNVPPTPPPVQGPAGPQGPAGSPGDTGTQGDTGTRGTEGAQGETGKTDTDTVVIVPVPTEQK